MAASIIGRWIKIQYKPLYNWKKKCREFGFWRIWENIQVRCVRSEGCFPYFCLFFNQLERICDLTALKLNTFFSTDIKAPYRAIQKWLFWLDRSYEMPCLLKMYRDWSILSGTSEDIVRSGGNGDTQTSFKKYLEIMHEKKHNEEPM